MSEKDVVPAGDDKPDGIRNTIAELLKNFLGPASKEVGAVIADQVRLYRWTQSIKILEKAEKIAQERKIERKELPYNFLVPFIEKSSLSDDDETLTNAWANLLVSASQNPGAQHRLFTDILSELDQREAKQLRDLFNAYQKSEKNSDFPFDFRVQLSKLRMHFSKLVDERTRGVTTIGTISIDEIFIAANDHGAGARLMYVSALYKKTFEQDHYRSPKHNLALDRFDIYHLERLGLVQVESFDFAIPASSVLPFDAPEVRFATMVLTALGYAFTATCEGVPIRGVEISPVSIQGGVIRK